MKKCSGGLRKTKRPEHLAWPGLPFAARRVSLAVVGLANETNRLSDGLRVEVDPQFK